MCTWYFLFSLQCALDTLWAVYSAHLMSSVQCTSSLLLWIVDNCFLSASLWSMNAEYFTSELWLSLCPLFSFELWFSHCPFFSFQGVEVPRSCFSCCCRWFCFFFIWLNSMNYDTVNFWEQTWVDNTDFKTLQIEQVNTSSNWYSCG